MFPFRLRFDLAAQITQIARKAQESLSAYTAPSCFAYVIMPDV